MNAVDHKIKVTKDQMGRVLQLNYPPKRIISLVPSISELIWDLGLNSELVGITKFCVNPTEMYRSIRRVGGTKQVKMDAIRELNPDLIIANKEENTQEIVGALEREFPVCVTDVSSYRSALEMIKLLGDICGKPIESDKLVKQIEIKYQKLATKRDSSSVSGKRVLYLIWKDPWMTIGHDTYIHHMLEIAGFENIYSREKRYPEITLKNSGELQPDLILLSSEPFPFKKKHIGEVEKVVPAAKAMLVDGEMFSWYGSRMLKSFDYFYNLQTELSL